MKWIISFAGMTRLNTSQNSQTRAPSSLPPAATSFWCSCPGLPCLFVRLTRCTRSAVKRPAQGQTSRRPDISCAVQPPHAKQ
jgi:hypothetical protein